LSFIGFLPTIQQTAKLPQSSFHRSDTGMVVVNAASCRRQRKLLAELST
jgi:hypothetical protein